MGSSGEQYPGRRGVLRWTAAVVTIVIGAGAFTAFPSAALALPAWHDARTAGESTPSADDGNEADAMAVVSQYEEAFASADCDLYNQVTTRSFRERIGLNDCDAFRDAALGRAEVLESLEFEPVSTDGMGRATIAALVHAELSSYIDEDGQQVDSPVPLDYDYRYHLVRADGAWKIDEAHDVTGGRTEGQLFPEEEDAVAQTMAEWSVAYSTGDCDALQASTTPAFREESGWADCAAFTQYISDQNAYCPMTVHQEDIRFGTLVGWHTGEIFVDVVEVCTLDIDEFGDPIDPPYETGAPYRYHLIDDDGTWRIAQGDNGAAAEDEPANANERAAVETISGYNDAWLDGDCETYQATTTEAFRIALNASGCASFDPAARGFSESVANFASTPTDIERPSAETMEIKAHETYDSLTDADGQPLETPFLVDEYWVYTLVLADGEWVISDCVMLL